MDLKDMIFKLAGPINPIGDHQEDQNRNVNLKEITNLVDDLLNQICKIAEHKDDQRASVRALGELADEFLKGVYSSLEEVYTHVQTPTDCRYNLP